MSDSLLHDERIEELEESVKAHENQHLTMLERIAKLEKENEMLLWAVDKTEKEMALLKHEKAHGDTALRTVEHKLKLEESRSEANLKYELQKQKEEYEIRIKQLEARVVAEESARFRLGKAWDKEHLKLLLEEAELKSQLLNRNNEVEWLKQELGKKDEYLVSPWGRDHVNSILALWELPDLTDEQWTKLYNGAPDELGLSDSHTDDCVEAIKNCLQEILGIYKGRSERRDISYIYNFGEVKKEYKVEDVECTDTNCPKEYHKRVAEV